MVQMHRRTDIRRARLDLQAIAVSITNDAEKVITSPSPFSFVRICVHQVLPILQTSLVRTNVEAEPPVDS